MCEGSSGIQRHIASGELQFSACMGCGSSGQMMMMMR